MRLITSCMRMLASSFLHNQSLHKRNNHSDRNRHIHIRLPSVPEIDTFGSTSSQPSSAPEKSKIGIVMGFRNRNLSPSTPTNSGKICKGSCHARSMAILSLPMLVFLVGAISQMSRFPTLRGDADTNNRNVGMVKGFSPLLPVSSRASNDGASFIARSAFHLCRVPPAVTVGYICRGSEYEAFADKLEALLDVQEVSTGSPSLWGKRDSPFPANTTILVVGNSLTRQVFQGLPCQYQDQGLLSWIDRESNSTNWMRRGTFFEGTFLNGAKLYLVTNHALFYSPKWPDYLQEMIGIEHWNDRTGSSRSLDGIVVGHINHFMNAYNTSFVDLMKEQTKNWDGANFETVSPPTLIDFASLYNGPILGVSMMADWSSYDQDYYEMAEQVGKIRQALDSSTASRRIELIHGRKYVAQLGECGSNNWKDVGNCVEAPDMHRCIGSRGGHPDLVLWDSLEALNGLLSGSR